MDVKYSAPHVVLHEIDVLEALCTSKDRTESGNANSLGKVDWSNNYGEWED